MHQRVVLLVDHRLGHRNSENVAHSGVEGVGSEKRESGVDDVLLHVHDVLVERDPSPGADPFLRGLRQSPVDVVVSERNQRLGVVVLGEVEQIVEVGLRLLDGGAFAPVTGQPRHNGTLHGVVRVVLG